MRVSSADERNHCSKLEPIRNAGMAGVLNIPAGVLGIREGLTDVRGGLYIFAGCLGHIDVVLKIAAGVLNNVAGGWRDPAQTFLL